MLKEIERLFDQLLDAFQDPHSFILLMSQFGWRVDVSQVDINTVKSQFPIINDLTQLKQSLRNQDLVEIKNKLQELLKNVKRLTQINNTSLPPPLNSQEFKDFLPEFPDRLLDFLLINHLID